MSVSENPTGAVMEMRRYARTIYDISKANGSINVADAVRLATLFEEMDDWLSQHGDPPKPWSPPEDAKPSKAWDYNKAFLDMRKYVELVKSAHATNTKFDPAMATKLATLFLSFDRWVCDGGDVPDAWAASEETF